MATHLCHKWIFTVLWKYSFSNESGVNFTFCSCRCLSSSICLWNSLACFSLSCFDLARSPSTCSICFFISSYILFVFLSICALKSANTCSDFWLASLCCSISFLISMSFSLRKIYFWLQENCELVAQLLIVFYCMLVDNMLKLHQSEQLITICHWQYCELRIIKFCGFNNMPFTRHVTLTRKHCRLLLPLQ